MIPFDVYNDSPSMIHVHVRICFRYGRLSNNTRNPNVQLRPMVIVNTDRFIF